MPLTCVVSAATCFAEKQNNRGAAVERAISETTYREQVAHHEQWMGIYRRVAKIENDRERMEVTRRLNVIRMEQDDTIVRIRELESKVAAANRAKRADKLMSSC